MSIYEQFENAIKNDDIESFKSIYEKNSKMFDKHDYILIFKYKAKQILEWFCTTKIYVREDGLEFHFQHHFYFTLAARYLVLYSDNEFVDAFIHVNQDIKYPLNYNYNYKFFLEVANNCIKYNTNSYLLNKALSLIDSGLYEKIDFNNITNVSNDIIKAIINNIYNISILINKLTVEQLKYIVEIDKDKILDLNLGTILESMCEPMSKFKFDKDILNTIIEHVGIDNIKKDYKQVFLRLMLKYHDDIKNNKDIYNIFTNVLL